METHEEWVTIWRFAILCVLIAFAAAFLGGCAAPAVREVRVPTYVSPKCDVRNVFEKCKELCMHVCAGDDCSKTGRVPIAAIETADEFRCACGEERL